MSKVIHGFESGVKYSISIQDGLWSIWEARCKMKKEDSEQQVKTWIAQWILEHDEKPKSSEVQEHILWEVANPRIKASMEVQKDLF